MLPDLKFTEFVMRMEYVMFLMFGNGQARSVLSTKHFGRMLGLVNRGKAVKKRDLIVILCSFVAPRLEVAVATSLGRPDWNGAILVRPRASKPEDRERRFSVFEMEVKSKCASGLFPAIDYLS